LYQTDQLGMVLVGITGTNGKTTVSHLVEAACTASGQTAGLIGTLGVRYPGVAHAGVRTTPEAPDLHRILAEMHRAGVTIAILEVTSHAIAEHRIDGLHFDVSAFTNLSRDHLDYHGTMERYFATKAQLFTPRHSESAIIGIDDDWGVQLDATVSIAHQTWSTRSPDADWFGQSVAGGISVRGPGGETEHLELPLPGGINVANATCATAILDHIGVPRTSTAFADVRVPGRMEMFQTGDGVGVIVDYAHTPAAITEIIQTTRGTGRTIVVFGAGGDRDRDKRPEMGAAASAADVIIITDDNPRSEEPAAIRAHILRGCTHAGCPIEQIGDRRAAIQTAISMAEPGDTVLVLGKGHEQGQEVAGIISPFDDREVVASAIRLRDAH
jgi:UDP-N-acetylmuramoyl-L-alanyl-D-glutamate--2,6-diaminopimelate ligase